MPKDVSGSEIAIKISCQWGIKTAENKRDQILRKFRILNRADLQISHPSVRTLTNQICEVVGLCLKKKSSFRIFRRSLSLTYQH